MKTLLTLKRLCMWAILPLVVSSCVDSDDPSFSVNYNGYIVQQNEDHGEGRIETRFAPYIAVAPYYYDDALSNVTLSRDGDSYYMAKVNDYLYETRLRWTTSIPNGTYTLSAQNVEGEVYTTNVILNGDKKLGVLNVKEFTYQANGGISASWDAVDNATTYGLMLCVQITDEQTGVTSFPWANRQYLRWPNGATITSGNFEFTGNYSAEVGTLIQVAVVAVYQNIYLIGPIKTLKVGTDGFVNDAPEAPEGN